MSEEEKTEEIYSSPDVTVGDLANERSMLSCRGTKSLFKKQNGGQQSQASMASASPIDKQPQIGVNRYQLRLDLARLQNQKSSQGSQS